MTTKEKILKILIENKDKYISGEDIAIELNLSRAAIGKVIQNFRLEGHQIEALNKSGYKYLKENDVLTKEALEVYKNDEYKIFFYDEIDSTNNEAKRLLNNGENAPFIVVAKSQSTGRGRRGRTFLSPIGGTYLTVVVESKETETELVTTKTAVAISRSIKECFNKETQIKWVNDLYYKDKKLCGILCEGVVNMELNQISEVVIGVGVNYKSEDIPKDIAISLFEKNEYPRASKAEFIINQAEQVFKIQKENEYLDEYKAKSFVLGKDVLIIKQGEEVEAKAIDIDEKAHLIVEYKNGQIEHLSSGEISLRPLLKQ